MSYGKSAFFICIDLFSTVKNEECHTLKIDKQDFYMTDVDYFAPNVCNIANDKNQSKNQTNEKMDGYETDLVAEKFILES